MSKVKNEATIKNPIVKAVREQLEHRALWLYLLCDEAGKRGLSWEDFGSAAVKRCGLYQVHFNRLGDYPKLQAALGFDAEHVWSQLERRAFLTAFYTFKTAYDKLTQSAPPVTTAEALLTWLHAYTLGDLRVLTQAELERSIRAIWPELEAVAQGGKIAVQTEAAPEPQSLLGRLTGFRGCLRAAFVYECAPEASPWIAAHEAGRRQLVQALGERGEGFGILHIDAHCDLRRAYEGFEYSHASIMYNVLRDVPQAERIVEVGVRDYCDAEAELARSSERIRMFDDTQLSAAAFEGETWGATCRRIVAELPERVYVSFDIDGLSVEYCPHTGTPVAGGLTFNQAVYLLHETVRSGRRIIGFDVVEVVPRPGSSIDASTGARILYKLCGLTLKSEL